MSERLPDATRLGAVHLTVANLGAVERFYRDSLGLRVLGHDGAHARLGAGGRDLVVLHAKSGARRAAGATGLYHLAVLVPSRLELATALARLTASRTPLQGASDHGVSEALYLADPEGNGIEIYRDRPRDEWPFEDGRLAMGSDPIDLDGLHDELNKMGPQTASKTIAEGTRIGHVHLTVADVAAAERFYVDALGFDVMARYGRALFVSAGGYHHHVALNTWQTAGAPPPPPGAAGLREFEVVLPAREDVERVAGRLRAAGAEVESDEDSVLVRDPSQNPIRLRAA